MTFMVGFKFFFFLAKLLVKKIPVVYGKLGICIQYIVVDN